MEIKFFVPGDPRGKGRPRFGRNGVVYTDRETEAYERSVVAWYRKSCGNARITDGTVCKVDIVAIYRIPIRASKVDRKAMEARAILPRRKPDADNVAKIILDALNGVAYKDDSAVVALSVRKLYGFDPGVWVSITSVPESEV